MEFDGGQNYGEINSLPTIEQWEQRYARSCEGNDQKAIRLFKEYESSERSRRMRTELISLRDGLVSESCVKRVVGERRISKHQSARRWAELMLIWLAQKYV